MRQISLALFSLVFSLLLTACVGPKVTVCIVDIAGFPCKNQKTGESSVVPLQEASDKNYVALPPEDFARLLDFMKDHCK